MSNELPALPPAEVTTQQLYILIAQMSTQMNEQNKEITALRESVEGLTEAWKAARVLIAFVKLVGAVAGAAATVWGVIKITRGVG